jgi:hypothetical protein
VSKRAKANKHNRRKRLFDEQAGLCHWCRKPMVLLSAEHRNASLPRNAATFDHVFPKWHERRWFNPRPSKPHPVVLACWSCNHYRGDTPFHEYQKLKHGDEAANA